MNVHSFDALDYRNRLIAVGVPAEQAETHATLLRDQVVRNLASRRDVEALETRADGRFKDMQERVDARFNQMEERFNTKLEALEQRFDAKLEALEQRVNAKLEALELRMTVRLGAMLAATAGLIIAAQRLL